MPASGLTWTLNLIHCPSNCHAHTVQSWTGVASQQVAAPDHDYPSHLQLILTATDGAGRSANTSVDLEPELVDLTFATLPAGLSLVVGTKSEATTPFTQTVIVGSSQGLSAAPMQAAGPVTPYAFTTWSDGGAASHSILAPSTPHDLYGQLYRPGHHHELPVRSALYGDRQRLGSGREGQEQRRASRPATAGRSPWPEVVFAKGLGTHAASDIRYPR